MLKWGVQSSLWSVPLSTCERTIEGKKPKYYFESSFTLAGFWKSLWRPQAPPGTLGERMPQRPQNRTRGGIQRPAAAWGSAREPAACLNVTSFETKRGTDVVVRPEMLRHPPACTAARPPHSLSSWSLFCCSAPRVQSFRRASNFLPARGLSG